MTVMRTIARAIIALALGLSLAAGWLAPHDYAMQFRDHANERPSHIFLLGTGGLGRDLFSRLLYGSRVSFLCAPVAALVATAIAAAVGLIGGYFGGLLDEIASA